MGFINENDTHHEFEEWAVAQGMRPNGIATKNFPGRGLGIIAEKEFNVRKTNTYATITHVIL